MKRVYIVSTRYIGPAHFFNKDNKTTDTVACSEDVDLHRCEQGDVVVCGFNGSDHCPENVDGFLDYLRNKLIQNDDNIRVVFILHDSNLGMHKGNFSYRDNVIGFQHENVDIFGHFLRTFQGSPVEFANRADVLRRGLKLYEKLGDRIQQCIYRLGSEDPLMKTVREFLLTECNCSEIAECDCIRLKKQLRIKLIG